METKMTARLAALPRRGFAAGMLTAALLALAFAGARADTQLAARSDHAKGAATPKTENAYNIGSIASEFLQSKARMTVLEHEDQAAAACQDKRFTKAAPVGAASTQSIGGISEHKWMEMWTVARCGTDVYYLIFFTEEGSIL